LELVSLVENFRRGISKKGSQFKVSIDFIGASPRQKEKEKKRNFPEERESRKGGRGVEFGTVYFADRGGGKPAETHPSPTADFPLFSPKGR